MITHTPARYTVYGSEGTGSSKTAFDLIKNYENAFLISGHSHFSLRHEDQYGNKNLQLLIHKQ